MKKIFCWFLIMGYVLGTHVVSARETDLRIEILKDRAQKGDLDAMCDLSQAYFDGKRTLKDPFKAACWAKRAYDLGAECAAQKWNDNELWRYSGPCEALFLPKSAENSLDTVPQSLETVEPVTGMRFRYISRRCFSMGCVPGPVKCGRDEAPLHKVCLDGFWIGVFEVTQAQWQNVMGNNPSRFRGDPDLPVENVSYEDVRRFLFMANGAINGRFELPSEAQWELACIGEEDEDRIYPWPRDLKTGQANCGTCNPGAGAGRTMATGSFPPNRSKLYDMGGNVMEWCRDYYDSDAYETHEQDNPVYMEEEVSRVVRGGSFADNPDRLRCSARQKALPGLKSERIGFRLIWIRE